MERQREMECERDGERDQSGTVLRQSYRFDFLDQLFKKMPAVDYAIEKAAYKEDRLVKPGILMPSENEITN